MIKDLSGSYALENLQKGGRRALRLMAATIDCEDLWIAVSLNAAFRCGQRYTLFKASLSERILTGQIMTQEPFTNFWGEPDAAETVEREGGNVVLLH